MWIATRGLIGVIVAMPTGVRYTNQTGGYACNHPELDGAFIPLGDRLGVQDELDEHFCGPKYNGWCNNGIDAETADWLDAAFTAWEYPLRVDRTALNVAEEAWVPVTILRDSEYDWQGMAGRAGVFVWQNSD